jgi:16S rRNA (uracil1498-N3)-methyltransferase
VSSTPRFFVDPWPEGAAEIVLPESVAHRVKNVLRMQIGDAIVLHDGANFAVDATLSRVEKAVVAARIGARRAVDTEPARKIVVAQALPRTTDKIEQVLQHGVELGASGFVFFQSERSVARMEARDRVEKKVERWREISRHAAEQSGRGIVPSLDWEPRVSGVASRLKGFDLALCLHERATVSLRERLGSVAEPSTICLVVGPEGGFSEAEAESFDAAGGRLTSLGARVLRTETAALAALAQTLFHFGE